MQAFYRHAVGVQGLPEHGNEVYYGAATHFLAECSEEQIRLAPEKCKANYCT